MRGSAETETIIVKNYAGHHTTHEVDTPNDEGLLSLSDEAT
jgi:hypothetical protein